MFQQRMFESQVRFEVWNGSDLGQCFGSVWGSVGIFRSRNPLILLNYMNLRERIARSNFIKINACKPLLSVAFLFFAISSKRCPLHFGGIVRGNRSCSAQVPALASFHAQEPVSLFQNIA